MKRITLTSILLLLLTSNGAFAFDLEVNGVFYNIIDKNSDIVEVTNGANVTNSYTVENLIIPSEIVVSNKTYKVKRIGQRAFMGCDKIKSIILPNSLTSIGNSAISVCKSLTSIDIPNSVTSIDIFAFAGCENLTSISLPISLDSISDALFVGCSSLTNIKIPDSVKYIGQKAFMLCSSLESIKIPKKVVELLGCASFIECKKLKYFEVNWEVPPKVNPFLTEDIDVNSCTLIVPDGLKSRYQAADGWKNFHKIEENNKRVN